MLRALFVLQGIMQQNIFQSTQQSTSQSKGTQAIKYLLSKMLFNLRQWSKGSLSLSYILLEVSKKEKETKQDLLVKNLFHVMTPLDDQSN